MVPHREFIVPLRSEDLKVFSWLEHGFGTRQDGAWTPPERTARLHQVHGTKVVDVNVPGGHGDGDALITAAAGVWLEIRTADCVPLLLVDPVRRTIAAIHAGWRGTAGGISRVTVERLKSEWGSNPGDLEVAIGPCIGACCFEVGDDVAAQFSRHIVHSSTEMRVDLVGANRKQLVEAGIPATNIQSLALCTVCNPESFHSFRRDYGSGRMITAIQIT
jgi:polyphenol oxidase